MAANRRLRPSAICLDGGCLRLLLSKAKLLRTKACLIFQQRLNDDTSPKFSGRTANCPACLRDETHAATTTGNSLSVIAEDADEVQDCLDESLAKDHEAKADKRIRVALEVLLGRTVCDAQRSAVVDDRLNAGAGVVPHRNHAESSSALNLDGTSCTGQVLARFALNPTLRFKRLRRDTGPQGFRALQTTCKVQRQSRLQHVPVRRITKRPDVSWMGRKAPPPLSCCNEEQAPPAAQGA